MRGSSPRMTIEYKPQTAWVGMAAIDDERNEPPDGHPSGAFFGRRKGHALRPRQASLLASLLPRLAVDLTDMEIGFGGGEHLLARAQANPRAGFIGCEPFVNGMAKILAAIDALRLDNIRLHHGDATE